MNIWQIFYNTRDVPDKFVGRRFFIQKKPAPTNDLFISDDLDDVRDWVMRSAEKCNQVYPVCFGRHPEDESGIVEVWL